MERHITENTGPLHHRSVFANNLRLLIAEVGTVSEVCRLLSLHRSQINRFLNAESYPKPDVLLKMCALFGTDARILLEPLDRIQAPKPSKSFVFHPEVSDFLQPGRAPDDSRVMPSGLYRFLRGCFIKPDMYQSGIIQIYEKDGCKFSRGFMARDVARHLGAMTITTRDREFRGVVFASQRGVVSMAAHRNAASCSFTYLDLKSLVEKSFLLGYCARTMPATSSIKSVQPAMYEKLPNSPAIVVSIARKCGFHTFDELTPFEQDALTGSLFHD